VRDEYSHVGVLARRRPLATAPLSQRSHCALTLGGYLG
jgi:hypothetical protein